MPVYSFCNEKLEHIKKVDFNLEKDIQKLVENNIEKLFNLKLIETEFQVDNFRLDTVAYNEENHSFIIIEYKKGLNYSVVDQGYSYLHCLLKNKAEFVLKFNEKFNLNYNKSNFDWSQSKIIFVSQKFGTYQLKAAEFKDLPFELWEVSKYEKNIMIFDKIKTNSTNVSIKSISSNNKNKEVIEEVVNYTEDYHLENCSTEIKEKYHDLKERIFNEFNDIEIIPNKHYISFKYNQKNVFECAFFSNYIKIWINLKKDNLDDPQKITRDISNIGHLAPGDYEFRLYIKDDLNYLMLLLKQSYENKIDLE